jgi:hypothetical protein
MTDQEKLNKKLEIWVFGHKQHLSCKFPNSLDACFEWLVPKVRATHHIHFHSYDGKVDWRVVLSNANETIYGRDNNPALALCLAIEKLIDTQGKK